MGILRNIYKVTRSVLFVAIGLVAAVYLLLYISLSVPSVQDLLREKIERELSSFLGSDLSIGEVLIYPFSEVVVKDVSLLDKSRRECLTVDKLGAGISLGKLLIDHRIEITYAELIGLDARIYQTEQGSPLNIQFLIDAFKPKRKDTPPAKFDLALHSVVIRRSKASFDREWMPKKADGQIDFSHLYVYDLRADVDIPKLSNEDYIIDLRRLSLKGPGNFDLQTLSLKCHFTPTSLSVRDLVVKLPGTDVRPADFSLAFPSPADIPDVLSEGSHQLIIIDSEVTPSDFSAFFLPLRNFASRYRISVELDGNIRNVNVRRFELSEIHRDGMQLEVAGILENIGNINDMGAILESCVLKTSGEKINDMLSLSGVSLPEKMSGALDVLGDVSFKGKGSVLMPAGNASADFTLVTSVGEIAMDVVVEGIGKKFLEVDASMDVPGFDIGAVVSSDALGVISFEADANVSLAGKDTDGSATLHIGDVECMGVRLSDINAGCTKRGKSLSGEFHSADPRMLVDAEISALFAGVESEWHGLADIGNFEPSVFGLLEKYAGYGTSAVISLDAHGNNLDNITGYLDVSDFNFEGRDSSRGLNIRNLRVESSIGEGEVSGYGFSRRISIESDFCNASINGDFRPSTLPGLICSILSPSIPDFIGHREGESSASGCGSFALEVNPGEPFSDFFRLPVRLLAPMSADGRFDSEKMTASLGVDMPYVSQGQDKLIRDTRVLFSADGTNASSLLEFHTKYPSKKGDIDLNLSATARSGSIFSDVEWKMSGGLDFNGGLSLAACREHDLAGESATSYRISVLPSSFRVNEAEWKIGEAFVSYADKRISVDNFKVWHGDQFVSVNGVASSSPSDLLELQLADIDLEYIFDTLNINYVTFGGIATGDIAATGVFSKNPIAATRYLNVKDLSYNGSVLGDGRLSSRWINSEKEVEIKAYISENGNFRADIDGGIWIGSDSLNFKINADKVNIGFLQPFMAAFSSDVGGRASGQANLYGNFHDIDLKGRLFADSIRMKVDYTNVYYSGSDSVYINPGEIIIPGFTLHDKYGHTASLTGHLEHRYFHDPKFEFQIGNARDLLCYDTNSSMNPVWYGKIFANGSGTVRGWPGVVSIGIDMALAKNSSFTFVISDEQDAADYHFLSFSDRKKEAAVKEEPDTLPVFLKNFLNRKIESHIDSRPSLFAMNLLVTVTPDALLTIVMDPEAGDKITARGSGPMRISYDSETDNLAMYGKYTLDEGSYNFTLQELILRDFTIRPGSLISFNGNPLAADLDIAASYRVNTNLSDLDKSFASDRDLNRTNVPVDALLYVKGGLEHPDITFDISLPTLTSDVERKVKSIISTEDMMSRQVIYLLALNRFYTPEYMGSQGSGGEFASVASSTLSSQFSRIVGQLTDKVSLAPSFRSDRGDFSDFEMDVALSSRLLDNRLLINGNFGYRDPSTSQTTFIGDFDIEYLLSKSGNLRLKAYNHFNDQNYYLKSSLTTQGLGVIYRRDFDNPFTFLKPRKRMKRPVENKNDSLKGEGVGPHATIGEK